MDKILEQQVTEIKPKIESLCEVLRVVYSLISEKIEIRMDYMIKDLKNDFLSHYVLDKNV